MLQVMGRGNKEEVIRSEILRLSEKFLNLYEICTSNANVINSIEKQ